VPRRPRADQPSPGSPWPRSTGGRRSRLRPASSSRRVGAIDAGERMSADAGRRRGVARTLAAWTTLSHWRNRPRPDEAISSREEILAAWEVFVIMAVEDTKPRSRRALLAGAAAGAAVLAAGQLARPLAVGAADGETVLVGHSYEATATTEIVNNATDADVFRVASTKGMGIKATSIDKPAIACHSEDECAVIGASEHGIALVGQSFGTAPSDQAIGVQGEGTKGGVWGFSTPGIGVSGFTNSGEGVHAESLSGTALVAVSHAGGHAIAAHGPVIFDSAGLLTIAAGKSSISKAVGALSATSMVLATLQTNRSGVYIQAALASRASGKITIYLNKKVTAATKVAYFILD